MNSSYKTIQQEYIFWLDTLGFNQKTILNYGNRVNEFFKWLNTQNITVINLLNQNHITTFFTYQETRTDSKFKGRLSASFLNDYFSAIDKLLEFLHQMGATNTPIPTNYRITIDNDKRVRKIDPFTNQEIKILQATINELYPNYDYKHRELKQQQLQLVFVLFYGCGLRLSEGFKLTAKDLNFNKRTLFVNQGKNYKDRIIPMSEGIYKALQNYLYNFRNLVKCGHNRLFVQQQITITKDLQHLHKQCKNESIQNKRLSFHILRHSIATHLLQNGMPIENIARFLGHNSLTSTQIYTHIVSR
ncbi:tyrosine-type recombinase/integrase [uncultured Maribacter sp.]|uniref:tyrosine-type recombinase/integrase n=1 Tax=uncultured Maribacter sp. TaxID=431308 RepID=UPI00263288EC|nr:tyrosine-type recombinase/integrase [uncultured Maribacter sp.]